MKPPLAAPTCMIDDTGILTIKWCTLSCFYCYSTYLFRGHVVSEAQFEPHKHSWLVEARRSDSNVISEVFRPSCFSFLSILMYYQLYYGVKSICSTKTLSAGTWLIQISLILKNGREVERVSQVVSADLPSKVFSHVKLV